MIPRKQFRKIAKATQQCWDSGEGPQVLVWSDGYYKVSHEGETAEYERRLA